MINYRPIAITSVLYKTMKIVIIQHLLGHFFFFLLTLVTKCPFKPVVSVMIILFFHECRFFFFFFNEKKKSLCVCKSVQGSNYSRANICNEPGLTGLAWFINNDYTHSTSLILLVPDLSKNTYCESPIANIAFRFKSVLGYSFIHI